MKTEEEVRREEAVETKPRKGFPAVGWLVFLIGAGALGYFIDKGIHARVEAASELKKETDRSAVPTVSVIRPTPSGMTEEVVLPGNIQAFTDTPIYARTNGYLKSWKADIGAHVKAGQLLAEIETPEVDQQLAQARADLATAEANLALAQSTAARYENLLKTDSVSKQETDEKTGDLNAKKAIVDSARFNVKRLEETQGFQKVYAPFDGVITARNTDIGALINAGASATSANGKELFHESATGTLRVFVNVPQMYAQAARVGSAANLTFNEIPGRHFRGTLTRTADAIDVASRTLLTEVDVDNANGQLLAGAYVSVHLKLPQKAAAMTIPVNTLIFRSEGLRVAVVRDGKAQLTPFIMGRDFGGQVEVAGGLTKEDQVIVNPSDSLTSGTPVSGGEMRGAALALAALAFVGCSVGPKYRTPTAQTPAAFKEPVPQEFKEDPNWKAGQPSDSAIRPKWWEIFGDAQLNSLEEKVDLANQSLKVAEAKFRQARAMIRFNQASQLPTISTQPSIANQHITAASSPLVGGGKTGGDFTLPFDLSYEVDLWGKIRKQVEAANEEFQATAADLQTVRLSLHSELAYDYFELRGLDSQKKVLDDTVEAYEEALKLTDRRYEGGLSPKSEVAQARTQLETARAQDIDTGVLRAQYEHAIAVLTGQPPETFSLAASPSKVHPPTIPTGVPSELLERRPDIAAAERRVAEANAQIGVARTAFYPSLTISAAGGFQGGSLVNWLIWPSRFWGLGPALGQTLFDNGRRKATSEAAVASYDATVGEYRQSALNAFQEVEDNLAALRVLSEEAKTQRAAVEAAEESLALSTNRYKGGLVTYLEVITAQSIALNNQRTEVDILRRRMDASVLLIKALGGGWNARSLPGS